jgi:RNA polymerase sigma-70 factor (ECF subfamily)
MPAPPPAPPGETVLFTRRLAAGDEDAWREFHGKYFDRLHRYALVLCHGEESAAREAVQLAFIRAVRYMKRFDQETALWGWLKCLARSVVVDEQRKGGRYRAFLTRWFGAGEPEPARNEVEADRELEELLGRELEQLDAEDRALVGRKYGAGVSVRQLAEERGETEKAVESRLGRLRKKLKAAVLARLKHAH